MFLIEYFQKKRTLYQSKQYDGKLNERKEKEQKFIVNGWKK